jgi:hypothetical protein
MDKSIVDGNSLYFQLVNIGIELVNNIFSLMDCNPELLGNNYFASKVYSLAIRWNETFIENFVVNYKGVIR